MFFFFNYRIWKKITPKFPSSSPILLSHTEKQFQKNPTSCVWANRPTSTIGIINYRFLTTETNLKALYIFCCFYNHISKAICSDCTDFWLQIFVYNCVFRKKEKQHSQNLSHFENKSTFQKRTTFWKWKLILKPILKMKTFRTFRIHWFLIHSTLFCFLGWNVLLCLPLFGDLSRVFPYFVLDWTLLLEMKILLAVFAN